MGHLIPNPVTWISAVIHLGKDTIIWETDVDFISDTVLGLLFPVCLKILS